jgi:hypothetical protein
MLIHLHVGDFAQATQQPVEQGRLHSERVAAGEQHVPHLGRAPDVVKLGFKFPLAKGGSRVAHDAAACAITTVAGALGRDQHQHPVRVAMDQARDG